MEAVSITVILKYVGTGLMGLITIIWSYKEILPKILDYIRGWKKERSEHKYVRENQELLHTKNVNDIMITTSEWALQQTDILTKKLEQKQTEIAELQDEVMNLRKVILQLHNDLVDRTSTIKRLTQWSCNKANLCMDYQSFVKAQPNSEQYDVIVPSIKELMNTTHNNKVEEEKE